MYAKKCVYLIEAVGMDLMKIGFTTQPMRRLVFIQTYCPAPIEILAIVPGDKRLEAIMHRQVAGLRVYGEWFRLTENIRRHCADFRKRWHDDWQEFLEAKEREPLVSKFSVADLSQWECELVQG